MKKTKEKKEGSLTGSPKIVGVDDISPNQWNYNEQSKLVYERQKISIHDHGFLEAILVRTIGDRKWEIIDGYHRWLACRELGYQTISVIDLGTVDDEVAKVMTITANELHGEPNELKLSKMLTFLAEFYDQDTLLEKLPYEKAELSRLIKLTSSIWDDLKPTEPLKESDDEEKEPEPKSTAPEMVSYSFVLSKDKFITFQNTIKKVMQDTQSSEGRAMELICADVLSGV